MSCTQQTQTVSAAAERMRRSRERRREGYAFSVWTDVRVRDIDALIARGLLAPEDRDDRGAVDAALRLLLDAVLKEA